MQFNKEHRHDRLDYNGNVRMFIAYEPWRLMLTMTAENISTSGVLVTLPQKSTIDQDAKSLIFQGEEYSLQLEHDFKHLPSPVVNATLVRTESTRQGLCLAFHFNQASADLLSMIHELN